MNRIQKVASKFLQASMPRNASTPQLLKNVFFVYKGNKYEIEGMYTPSTPDGRWDQGESSEMQILKVQENNQPLVDFQHLYDDDGWYEAALTAADAPYGFLMYEEEQKAIVNAKRKHIAKVLGLVKRPNAPEIGAKFAHMGWQGHSPIRTMPHALTFLGQRGINAVKTADGIRISGLRFILPLEIAIPMMGFLVRWDWEEENYDDTLYLPVFKDKLLLKYILFWIKNHNPEILQG